MDTFFTRLPILQEIVVGGVISSDELRHWPDCSDGMIAPCAQCPVQWTAPMLQPLASALWRTRQTFILGAKTSSFVEIFLNVGAERVFTLGSTYVTYINP